MNRADILLTDRSAVARYTRDVLGEGIYALYVDVELRLIGIRRLSTDPTAELGFDVDAIFGSASGLGARGFFLVRSNPNLLRFALRGDLAFTSRLRTIANDLDVPLIDHLIIDEGVRSVGGLQLSR